MRCTSCNRALNDFESTRRLVSTGDFLDMCNTCYKDIEKDVPTISREDLAPTEEIEGDEYWEGVPSEWGDVE